MSRFGPPDWPESPEEVWEDMAADRAAAALLGIPLADDDDFRPARAACVPAAIPIHRPRRTPWRPDTRPDPRKEHTRAAA